MQLTERQQKLLTAIISEFIHTAQAVGSLELGDKYRLEVSPATIRNEMAILAKLGLIAKPHASSGRVPTSTALKWFLRESLQDYETLDAIITASIRERLFQRRFNVDRLLSQAVVDLFHLTDYLAVAIAGDHHYTAGMPAMLDFPEYRDYSRLKVLLAMLEDYKELIYMLNKYGVDDGIQVIFSDDIELSPDTDIALAFTKIKLHNNQQVYLGVIGPYRMNYAKVIPSLNYVVQNLEDVSAGWK